ncbi:MAG: tetratricopeptide repeat protein, partial [Acidobacteriota bacterium]
MLVEAGLPETPPVRLGRGRLLASAARYQEALECFDAVRGTEVDDDRMRADYGQLLLQLNDRTRAKANFALALERNPDNVPALSAAAELAIAEGDTALADRFESRLAGIRPRSAGVHLATGRIRAARGRWAAAVESLSAAAALESGRPAIWRELGRAQLEAGMEEQSVATLRRALDLDPGDPESYRTLADAHVRLRNLDQAVIELERGTGRVSRDAHRLWHDAAVLRERRQEPGQALLNYQAMFDSLPDEEAARERNSRARHIAYLSGRLVQENASGTPAATPMGAGAPGSPALCASAIVPGFVLAVPGGVQLLARSLGIEAGPLQRPDGLEHLSAHLLSLPSADLKRAQDAVGRYLRHYKDLLEHLRKKRLIAAAPGPPAAEALAVPLGGDEEAIRRASDLLSYFGIKLKAERRRDLPMRVVLTISQRRKPVERQQLLRDLGVNMAEASLREIRLHLRDDGLPSLFDEITLAEKILRPSRHKSRPFLERWVRDPEAMRLYLALARCSDSVRRRLVEAMSAEELSALSDRISLYGPFMAFQDERLDLPGMAQGWEGILGVPVSEPAHFLSAFLRFDGGGLLRLYCLLEGAAAPVRRFLTETPERLTQLYSLLPPEDTDTRAQASGSGWSQTTGRLLRLLRVDQDGLYLPLDPRLDRFLFPPATARAAADSRPGLPLDLPRFAYLVNIARKSAGTPVRSIADTIEFLAYIGRERPELLAEDSIPAVMYNPADSAVFLDLIWDLRPASRQVSRYLDYCRTLARAYRDGWNERRTRTSQSVFFLLSALRRERILGEEAGLRMLDEALDAFRATDEARFAFQVAVLITDHLLPALERLPELTGQSPDPITTALAGDGRPAVFYFDGSPMEFHASSHRLERIAGVLQLQQTVPLADVLAATRALAGWTGEGVASVERLHGLAESLIRLQPGRPETGLADERGRRSAADGLPALRREMESRLQTGRLPDDSGRAADLANRVAASLHSELGITLLAYCYAYAGSPMVDALAFDDGFVRKHDFSGGIAQAGSGWIATRAAQKQGEGTYLAGSLSGLGFQLSRFETSTSALDLKAEARPAPAPSLLSDMRSVHRPLRTDAAQEYVALSVRLGGEVLAAAAGDGSLRNWCHGRLAALVEPRRREGVASCMREDGNGHAGAEMLTPSELLLLGLAYQGEIGRSLLPDGLLDGSPGAVREETAAAEFPVLDRLRALAVESGSPPSRSFLAELEQYGPVLRRRLGLGGRSFLAMEPYRRLESEASPDVLFERMCDLKIRIAEIAYTLGLPAALGELLGEQALREIITSSDPETVNQWPSVIDRVKALSVADARNWIERLIRAGAIIPA